jgi:hypothetical protein
MSDINQMIENATAYSKSLGKAVEDFVSALTSMRDQAVSMEEDLNERKLQISGELDRLTESLLAKRQEHRQVEASIRVLKERLAELEADRNKIKSMFTRVENHAA